MNSTDVINALRNGPFREPAHAWLYEVLGGTGDPRLVRRADALVVSVWPSRGIWIAGIEVKVSRSDWRKELDSPQKSAEIQKWCDYWWVAAPEGIVEPGEVPDTWGHYVIKGKKARAVIQAPKLEPEPLTIDFVASVLRNEAVMLERARLSGFYNGRKETEEELGKERVAKLEAEVRELTRENKRLANQAQYANQRYTSATSRCSAFEKAIGLPEGTVRDSGQWHLVQNVARTYRAAVALCDLNEVAIASKLEGIARTLREVGKETFNKDAAE